MSAWEIVLAVVGSVGGSAVILAGLTAWLGKVMAARITVREKANHAKELEVVKAGHAQQLELLRNELDVQRHQMTRTSDAQFELYNDIWKRLYAVKLFGDHLWERATRDNLEAFVTALANARVAVEHGRLIIIDTHYDRLQDILGRFDDYYLGKCRLVDLRSQSTMDRVFAEISEGELTHQVRNNEQIKTEYEQLLNDIAGHFKREMGTIAQQSNQPTGDTRPS